eukprot:gene9739-biopygen8912
MKNIRTQFSQNVAPEHIVWPRVVPDEPGRLAEPAGCLPGLSSASDAGGLLPGRAVVCRAWSAYCCDGHAPGRGRRRVVSCLHAPASARTGAPRTGVGRVGSGASQHRPQDCGERGDCSRSRRGCARSGRVRPTRVRPPRAGRARTAREGPRALSLAARSCSPRVFRSPGVGTVMFALHPALVFVPTELAATELVPP